MSSRRELLDRWRGIEEEEERNDDDNPLKLRRLHQRKEQWFAHTFTYLISLPEENHIWCGSWDLMGPLLETFYNYFKDDRPDSPLRLLWKRISQEMRHCIQCISQHHQAQELYAMEYEFSSIGPLLDVLRTLDEERLTQHLREINATLNKNEYDPLRDNAQVVSLMYEVLMFPILLDDQSLFTEFELFIEAVDEMNELALAGYQHFPVLKAKLYGTFAAFAEQNYWVFRDRSTTISFQDIKAKSTAGASIYMARNHILVGIPVSSNFNVLTRKLACKIALLIIHRGYKMNPPCPPVECAHMWGPSLVSSLKDSSLHNSLRQPAFDLVQTVIVSDAAALVTALLNNPARLDVDTHLSVELNDGNDDGLPFSSDVEEKDENMVLAVRPWLSSSATEISTSFGWKVPTGFDDGGGGKESKNSLRVSMMHLPLIRTFNRLTAHFLVQMGQGELRKQWTWEPGMAESLILSLFDPNDSVRQVGKCLLEQVSNTRGLACGLEFLCSSGSSLSATYSGLRHALKVVSDQILLNDIYSPLFQMTCVRVLEILPVVYERLCPSIRKRSRDSGKTVENLWDFIWLHDLIDWGRSSLKVVVVYWKRTVTSLLNNVNVDQLMEQVSHLRVSLSKEVSYDSEMAKLETTALLPEDLPSLRRYSDSDALVVPLDYTNIETLDSASVPDRREKSSIIVVSDDEVDEQILHAKVIQPINDSRHGQLDNQTVAPAAEESTLVMDTTKDRVSISKASRGLWNSFEQKDVLDRSGLTSQKQDSHKLSSKPPISFKSIGEDYNRNKVESKGNVNDAFSSQCKITSKNSDDAPVSAKSMNQSRHNLVSETRDSILKKIVRDANDDLSESALKSVRQQPSLLAKLSACGPKRQLIQLKTPFENRCGTLQRMGAVFKRFKPPKLDDWYRPILEINYFEAVGLASASEDEDRTVGRLKEVPVCFQSPEQYVEIFQPLVLEEFKAQLHSSFLEMSSWEDMYYGNLSVLSVERVDDFHLVRFVHDDNVSALSKIFSENDLVLLTKEAPQSNSHDVHMVGKVERRERDNKRRASMLLIRFYFLNGSSRLNQARKQLLERSKWHASRIMSITPQLREFQVLSSIKDIPILSAILKPVKDSPGYNKSRELALGRLSQPLQQALEASFNDSQLEAISVAIGLPNSKKDFELSLIQGPPGTGKTRTIVAIVSGLLGSLHGTNDAKHSLNGRPNNSSCSMNTRPKVSQSVALARAWQDAALARQLNEDVGRNEESPAGYLKRRVLICAQSNAAVDELVSRISSGGLYGSDGKMYKPYIVRVGNAKTVHQNSMPFFIDTLVDHRLAEERNLSDAKNDSSLVSSTALRSNLEKLVDRIRYYEAKRANLQNSDLKNSLDDEMLKGDDRKEMSDAELEVKLRKLYEQKKQIFKDLSTAQAQEKKTNEEIKNMKHKLRKSILKEAEIVVTTLSGSGGDLYGVCSESMSSYKFGNPSERTLFDAVIIDEAAQALEPATLIPLQLLKSNGTKCIMVGDPKQLPATVLSNVASKFLYECSMFERLQRAGHPVTMLTKQYRMHPDICQFPSLHFYDGKLLNGENMSSKLVPFHETEGLGPYAFYDVIDGQELRGKNSAAFSLYNEREADAAVELLRFFKKRHPSEFEGGKIGIITPYKCQLSLLRSRLSSAFGSSVIADMEFNTVDGFQGREVDILILSSVRAGEAYTHVNGVNSSSIGFVADVRRMNVALTRAKLSLWIFGNARTLQANHNWAALIKDAKQRNLVISVKRPYKFLTTAPRDHSAPEKSDNHSRQAKNFGNFREPSKQHRSSKHIGSVGTVTEDDVSANKDSVCSSKKRGRDDHGILPVDDSGENRILKNVKSPISREYLKDGGSKCSHRSKKKLDSENPHVSKRTDKCMNSKSKLCEQETSNNLKKFKSNVVKGPNKSFKHDSNLETSTSPAEDSVKRMGANDGRAPDQIGASEDLITKRKQQREAVDAILYSSLISSKKSEQSKKPVPTKRLLPPSSVNSCIKPAKSRKALRTSRVPCALSLMTTFLYSSRSIRTLKRCNWRLEHSKSEKSYIFVVNQKELSNDLYGWMKIEGRSRAICQLETVMVLNDKNAKMSWVSLPSGSLGSDARMVPIVEHRIEK
ncbi:splicing endonuclease positive effector sen1, putative [Ricinus communis]|uniref:Splicing endonuclease positive effector sen1, putative n=1 Tax=Ricinus communis TaxID=3988 RepID=B9RHU2_RICCO|nr:splicing endonuclease positive effector sen1, putative [Ricinus communis]